MAGWEERQRSFIERLSADGRRVLETGTMVVVPSLTFAIEELAKIKGLVYYEERLLFLALLLQQPDLRIVYITSAPIDPAIVDYYLSFVPDASSARGRLELITLDDLDLRPLTEKLLARPDLLDRIRSLDQPGETHLVPFRVTSHEQALSEALAIPLFGPPANLEWLGSKTGSRRIGREAGVRVVEGSEDLWSMAQIEEAMERIRAHAPHAEAVVIKLNNGFSGQGNVIVELNGPPRPLAEMTTVFCASQENWSSFASKVEAEGAVVEELVRGEGMTSPSVQLRIIPGQPVEILSTHDQILGGPERQVYLGCRFPADSSYRLVIQEAALKVGRELASRGMIGYFGIDFLAAPGPGGNAVYLSEINLRMGGTTHPFWMARLATSGRYDATSGELLTPTGSKSYVASDNFSSRVGMTPQEMITAVHQAGLAFDAAPGTGATLHLLGALPKYGKVGVTCIANSSLDADSLYQSVVAVCSSPGQK
jgi:hypothetical protein